jgi:hypothetical protein
MKKSVIPFIVLISLTALAEAGAGPSLERGKELFTGPQLGTNGKSCAGCHPGGKGLERAAAYEEGELGEIINQCIKKPLKGNTLDPASADMKSLIMYIRTFANQGKR